MLPLSAGTESQRRSPKDFPGAIARLLARGKSNCEMRSYKRSSRMPLVCACCKNLKQAVPNVIILLGGYELYRAISLRAPRQTALAHAHATALIDLERRIGIAVEGTVQRAALQHGSLAGSGLLDGGAIRQIVRVVYAGSQLHWLAAMLLWLYVFHRERFAPIRNVLVAGTLLAIAFSALYAVAPPRFAMTGPLYGVVDVLHPFQSEAALVRQSVFDPFASLPSTHMLWAALTGLGLYAAATSSWQRLLAALFPAAMVPTVIVTGNHYILDCIASVVLVVACILAERARVRVCARRPRRANHKRTFASAFPVHERRSNPNLRPLDRPLALGATMAVILIISSDPAQRAIGLGLLVCLATVPPVVRHRIQHGDILCTRADRTDWYCGFLFVVGSTCVGAGDANARFGSAVLWLAAALLPLIARVRVAKADAAPATILRQPLSAVGRERAS